MRLTPEEIEVLQFASDMLGDWATLLVDDPEEYIEKQEHLEEIIGKLIVEAAA